MPLSVNYLFEFTQKLIRKSQAGGISSTEFAYQWNDSQGAYQDDLIGRFQAKNTGRAVMVSVTDATMTKLAPFISPVTLTITAGVATKPSDFLFTLALRINNTKVFHVDHDEIWSMNNDVIDPPSIAMNSYYYTEYGNGYQIYPTGGIASLDLDYIKTPTDIFWNYTLDINGMQVYNPSGSIDPIWDSNSAREITKRMLKNIGVSFHDKDFEQFGESIIKDGD